MPIRKHRQERFAARSGSAGGFIYIEALMVIMVLVALMAVIAADQRASLKETQTGLNRRRADAAAASGVAYALGALQQANPNLVTQNDAWAQLDQNGATQYSLTDSSFRVEVVDRASQINVNTATTTWLQQLPLTTDQVDSLLDWRETGTQARADGAKDAYYNGLTKPYNARLGPLATVDELLLIKGWTGATLYQPPTTTQSAATLPVDTNGNALPLAAIVTVDSGSPTVQANGSARINLSQRITNIGTLTRAGISRGAALQIIQRGPFNNFRTLLTRIQANAADTQRLLNVASFSTGTRNTGKINLNTATQAVLMTIPNMTEPIASSIVSQQSSGFQTLGQLATLAGMPLPQISQFADYFDVGSDTWLIRSYGESGGVGSALEVTVRVSSSTPRVMTWQRLNTAGLPSWWDWDATAGTTSDATSITNTSTTSTVGGAQ